MRMLDCSPLFQTWNFPVFSRCLPDKALSLTGQMLFTPHANSISAREHSASGDVQLFRTEAALAAVEHGRNQCYDGRVERTSDPEFGYQVRRARTRL